MRQRKNVVNLSGPEAGAFVEAVRALKGSRDPASNYSHFTQIHVDSCIHGCELFLPWHRAFILDYEDALRAHSAGAGVTLPYWNWISTPRVPDLFLISPLLHARTPGATERLPTAEDLGGAFQIHEFFRFGGSRCQHAVPAKGRLDSLHGQVHKWVGGDMADLHRAAFDPIFWSHHSFVDLLWARWQNKFGQRGPSETNTRLRGLDSPRTAGDVLDIGPNGLAYEYVEDAFDLRSTPGAIGPRARFTADLGRVKSEFSRAEVRLVGLGQAPGSPIPSAIDVATRDMRAPARLSLFGLHPRHEEMHGEHNLAGHPTSLSSFLDVTTAFSEKSFRGEMEIEIDLVAPRGVPEDTCRIECERIQLVLLPA